VKGEKATGKRPGMDGRMSLNLLAATVLGLGKAPAAPGTVATLAGGVPCFLAVGHLSWVYQALLAAVIFAAGWRVSGRAEIELQKTDAPEIVIDELCGFIIAMVGHPVGFASVTAGFVLFRIFDIWKPWPLRLFQESLSGGLGVMMDDVGAGIYANIAGLVIMWAAGWS
jgi:phosphatidylglycerophosphatase A